MLLNEHLPNARHWSDHNGREMKGDKPLALLLLLLRRHSSCISTGLLLRQLSSPAPLLLSSQWRFPSYLHWKSYNIVPCSSIDIELNVFVFNSTTSWHMSATCYSDEYDDVMINVSWCSTTVQVSLHQVHLLTKPTVCSLHIILYNRWQRIYPNSVMC